MSFEQIVGHGRPLKILRRALETDRVAHAYLFTGPDGVGKATTARFFAKALLCLKGADDACGECGACRKFDHGNHPDIIEIAPDDEQIKIDQIREFQNRLAYAPIEGRWRVGILNPANALNVQASNALLKILEEPPEGNVLILLAQNTFSLLPTVVSRCQVLPFMPLRIEQIVEFLCDRRGWDRNAAQKAASYAQGSIGQAIALEDSSVAEDSDAMAEFLSEMDAITEADVLERVGELMNDWPKERKKAVKTAKEKLKTLKRLFRDGAHRRLGVVAEDVFDDAGGLKQLASEWSLDELMSGWEWVSETQDGMDRNWNILMSLEHLFLRLNQMKRQSA